MSYEQCEGIKAIVGILICSIALLIMIIKHIIFIQDDKRYKNELRAERERLSLIREKKLENLKLESISLNLNIKERDMLFTLLSRTNQTECQFLRDSIREIIKSE
ncbi:hypothetical protein [Clostridium sp. D53t1_180928_C8]|uniref:hypothetical protein n=1 Tax=Clostridium sp. D53t1_180928_C8 TaxID=2787101 RepID=UPI0018AA9322|nr:hypothetical protein [Clostridium sp. D53t1_180928_C8]